MNTALKHRPAHLTDIPVTDTPIAPPPNDQPSASDAEDRPTHRRKVGWTIAGIAAATAMVAAVAITSADNAEPVTDTRPAISSSPAGAIVQESIDQGLAERAAGSVGPVEVSSYQLVQESIDQGLAERVAASVEVPAYLIVQESIDQALAELEGSAD